MLNKIIQFSLSHRLFILIAAVLLMVGGLWAANNTDIDVFPDLTAPQVVVMTDAHGMASDEVERLVTFPIETAVNGASNVRRVRSTSMQGASFVFVEFDWGMDVFKARQIVSEKMTTLANELPAGVTPVLAPQSSVMGEILFVGLQVSDSVETDHPTSQQDLRTLAEWVVKPAILGTGGVSQVTIIGGDYKQYQILADPFRMETYGVTMADIEALGASLSRNSTGGVVRDYGNEYALRGMGRTNDVQELGRTLVTMREGHPVLLADVADVQVGAAVHQGYASCNAKPAVILSVSKQPNINTLRVTENIEANLAEVQKGLPPDVHMNTKIFRQADFIESSVGNVGKALLEGAFFVIVILFLFLGSFRTTLISIISIPLSLLGTVLCLHLLGLEINTMTLGGMCIAIGSLVDDAIIDVENVFKRLRQNHQLPPDQRDSALHVVFLGSSEIRSSIVHATFIIMITFVPLFFLSGLEGRMLKPLGIAYIISLFMSLVVAMTLTPLLCKLLLSSDAYLERSSHESRISAWLTKGYSGLLEKTFARQRPVLAATLLLLALAVGLLFTMGRDFLPPFNEGSLTIAAVAKPGISLEESNRLGRLIEKELLDIPEVTSTSRRTGRGELDEHSQATNGAEIDVNFQLAGRSKEAFMEEVRSRLASIPGIVTSVGQPLGHRIDHMVSGTQATIAIKIFGNDLPQLYLLGNQVKGAVAGIEGLVDVNVEQQAETPQLQIRADRDLLARYGITMEQFNRFVETAFYGEKIGDVYEGQRSFDLVIKQRLGSGGVPTIDDVRDALIDTYDGAKVPLSAVAEIVSTGGPNTISRENVQRKLVVSANVSGRDAVSVVEDIRQAVDAKVALPEGCRIEYGGQFASAKSATRTLVLVFLIALAVIFLLLYVEFKSLSLSLIVLVNLPLALIGGVLALKVTGSTLSIPALIGFITLFGIATRNGILLVAKYQAQLQGAGRPSAGQLREVVLRGSADRFAPIIMTALTTALSLIPMVLAADQPGNEIQSPMAVVVLGGLITSTLLNLFVVPIVFSLYAKHSNIQSDEADNSLLS